jgi:hypothetical protein
MPVLGLLFLFSIVSANMQEPDVISAKMVWQELDRLPTYTEYIGLNESNQTCKLSKERSEGYAGNLKYDTLVISNLINGKYREAVRVTISDEAGMEFVKTNTANDVYLRQSNIDTDGTECTQIQITYVGPSKLMIGLKAAAYDEEFFCTIDI